MARAKKITDEQLVEALIACAGIKADAAKMLKISRQAVQERVDRTPALQAATKQAEEELLDISESGMVTAIKAGDGQMIRYYQDRKGKKRGYGNSVSVGADEAAVEAIVLALGGDVAVLRAALAQLGVSQGEIP